MHLNVKTLFAFRQKNTLKIFLLILNGFFCYIYKESIFLLSSWHIVNFIENIEFYWIVHCYVSVIYFILFDFQVLLLLAIFFYPALIITFRI